DLCGVDPENFKGNLSQRRLQALPVRMDANAQFEAAIRGYPSGGLLVSRHHRNSPARIDRGAVRALLAINRKAEPQQVPIRLALGLTGPQRRQIEMRQGASQRFGIIAAVEMFSRD